MYDLLLIEGHDGMREVICRIVYNYKLYLGFCKFQPTNMMQSEETVPLDVLTNG